MTSPSSAPATLARLRGVLLDIDGTITTAGRLGAPAYAALYFRYDHERRRMIRGFARSDAERARERERLKAIGDEVLRAVPGSAIAADQLYRDTDLAIDYCEDVPPLPPADVHRIHALLTAHGLTAKVSSIHVNAWYGTHDKLSMTRRLMREQFGIDLDAERSDFAFIGDSPNDEPMFAYFPRSFAVANIAPFVDQLDHPPACVIEAEEGAGFVLFAEQVLAARRAAS